MENETGEASAPKRSRSKNFTRSETLSLTEIIKNNDFGRILETHGNDNSTVEEKKKAWNEISEQYNALPNISKRDLPQLKAKWKSLVQQAKSVEAEFKSKTKATGGGGPPADSDPLLVSVKEMCSSTFSEILNPYDGDALQINQTEGILNKFLVFF